MTDLVLIAPQTDIRSYFLISYTNLPEPQLVSARDFGYQIDEQDLAEEWACSPSLCISTTHSADVPPEDFESTYQWFLS